MRREDIISHASNMRFNREDTERLIEDSKLFVLEEDSGHLRPQNYSFMASKSGDKIRNLDDRYLVILANMLRRDLNKINLIQPAYVVSEGPFTLNVWIRIIKRELSWRKITDNRIYNNRH